MKTLYIILSTCYLLSIMSCKKAWLDVRPNKAIVVPSEVKDYQSLLDNAALFNKNGSGLGEVSADNYYLLFPVWQSLGNAQERNAYIWAKDIYQGETGLDWRDAYTRILTENVVLDGIEKIKPNQIEASAWNNVKGSALFYRAYDFFNLAQEFCKPYLASTASTDLGIPLRKSSDIFINVSRSTVQETYDQIINDLMLARQLLPDVAVVKTRPSVIAVYALLARIYLSMKNYDKALLYSDSSLQNYNTLLDYNTLNETSLNPVPRFNEEVIYHSLLSNYEVFFTSRHIVDSMLYQSHDDNDLRKTIFYRTRLGQIVYKGSYDEDNVPFSGLATDELYLIRAECLARKNAVDDAMNDLNTLLQQRWRTGTFIPFTATTSTEALKKILQERRKELVFRGLRWSDLRRLNQDPAFAVTLTRELNGQTFKLPPNDPKYVLPISDDEIRLSGIEQNPR